MSVPAFIAVDWGTTNRRIYALGADGAVLAEERDARGVLAMTDADWASEMAAIRARFGDAPALLAGMAGSTRGWRDAPYLPAPVGLDDLAANLVWIEPGRTAIVPGVGNDASNAPDLMRGEEVQLLGAVAAGLVPADALLVQPGTHNKWARVVDGRIASMRTAMTGELFALLRNHSLLGDFLTGEVYDGAAFRAGLALADAPLSSALFGERARVLLARGTAEDAAARVSGLLIGQDVAAARLELGETAYLLADEGLGALYAAAIEVAGGAAVRIDSHTAFVAGITSIWNLLP